MIFRLKYILLVLLLFGIGCSPLPLKETRMFLGTEVTITIHKKSRRLRTGLLWAALDSSFREVRRIHELAGRMELYQLNGMAGYDYSYITKELVDLINLGYDVMDETNAAYRPDMDPLMKLWGFKYDEPYVPESWEVDSVLTLVDSTIFTMSDTGFARLDPHNAALDLGGIAKGYAVDRACQVLQSVGILAGVVEAGGDLRCFGTKPGGKPWRFAIRHPRELGEFYTTITIDSGAVATSGDYERYFMDERIKYHHIIDPKTGYPARGAISCTVVSPTCVKADAYATAFFVLGKKRGVNLAEELGVETLILTEEFDEVRAYETEGFKMLHGSVNKEIRE